MANAIDLKDELLALPRAGSSHGGDAAPNGGAGGLGRGAALAPMDQRAAGISMCLALLCGWRDFKAYRQQYGRWEWARRVSLEDSLVSCIMHKRRCRWVYMLYACTRAPTDRT